MICTYFTGNVYGIAIGSFFTTLAGVIFGYLYLRKYIDYNIRDIFKEGLAGVNVLMKGYVPVLRK